ncbi:MAG: hypothetical protein V1834_04650 [Candidatus Micrarchaeota archaeon]
MDKSRAFLKLIEKTTREKLVFTEHFRIRKQMRGVSEAMVDDYLFNRPKDLIYAEEEPIDARKRFKAYYRISKKKVLMLVLDNDENGFIILVTCLVMDKREQASVMKNADRYSKFASRLR